jgi:hypothetical protein
MSVPVVNAPPNDIGWAWFPGETEWQRATLSLRTTIAGTGLEVGLDRPGHDMRVELINVINIDALADAPDGFDWVELTVEEQPRLQLIWPEHLTDTVLTALRSTMLAPAVVPLPTPGRVHDPILDRATASSVLDLREKSEKRGRLVALSALSAAVLVAGGVLAWTMLDDDSGPETKVNVAGITQTNTTVASTTVPDAELGDAVTPDDAGDDGG